MGSSIPSLGTVQQVSHGNSTTTTNVCAPNGHRRAARILSTLADDKTADQLIQAHMSQISGICTPALSRPASYDNTVAFPAEVLTVGLAALDAFLQANVTGPVLPADLASSVENRFAKAWTVSCPKHHNNAFSTAIRDVRRACIAYLHVDGVSTYHHIPYLELFSLARFVVMDVLTDQNGLHTFIRAPCPYTGRSKIYNLAWMRLRVNVWHYKLLTQPSLTRGASFAKSSQWSDVPTLASAIFDTTEALTGLFDGQGVMATAEAWTREDELHFFLEAANNYIFLGYQDRARQALRRAAKISDLEYILSSAMGKRTKFQEKSISQLVVLARSKGSTQTAAPTQRPDETTKPQALQLNDDTLLEEIDFTGSNSQSDVQTDELPPGLKKLAPDDQPQLTSLDQILLLTEATIQDAFSPIDTLTSEQVLPFAVRVLADKEANWQIYTQALLVRARIELHRSRTVERGVLQLQAITDQVIANTSTASVPCDTFSKSFGDAVHVPPTPVTEPEDGHATASGETPTTFLPAPKVSEAAPADVRLRYVHALCTPPRWHLESELAQAWAGVGSLTSALEIFKRLHMWAEVALCLASKAASEDEDVRGSGGQDRAKAIIRWRLFHRTNDGACSFTDPDDEDVNDMMMLKPGDYAGPERTPPPSNAARLWCILGDIEEDAACYERAWEVSDHRFARAQRSLGKFYVQKQNWRKAYTAYKTATSVNRLSPSMWGRLGDISLRLGQFEDAVEAYSRSIGSSTDNDGGEDAKTWSNLGSSLWSMCCAIVSEAQVGNTIMDTQADNKEEKVDLKVSPGATRDAGALLAKSLAAYKTGASIAHDNWRIWDNVLTLAARMHPPAITDMVLALKHIVRIRKDEEAIDIDVLSALLQDAVLAKEKHEDKSSVGRSSVYDAPRGSTERLVTRLVEEEVVPLITRRAALWALVARLRVWRRDHAGALDASERAWRAAVGASGGANGAGLLPGSSTSPASSDWLVEEQAWDEVVQRTDELVSHLENWGPHVASIGARWRTKARSAVRSVMGRARESWEGSAGWITLQDIMTGLQADKAESQDVMQARSKNNASRGNLC